jgi:transcriptional regulator with XRE-family HTH domain
MSEISDFMSDILSYLAQNLKYYRAKLGMTQAELAKQASVNRSHLASIESGTQPNTSIKTVEKLAAALGVSAFDLLRPADTTPETMDKWATQYGLRYNQAEFEETRRS